MDNQELQIWCVNDGKRHKAELGTTLQEISKKWCTKVRDPKTGVTGPVLAALVDHKLKELSYRMVVSHEIEFIGYSHPEGRRCYVRSLCFVLQKAVRDLFPDKILVIDHSLPSGLYCEIKESEKIVDGHHPFYFLKDDEIEALKQRMRDIVAADFPFTKTKVLAEDAIAIYEKQNQLHKAALIRSLGQYTASMYTLDGTKDSFHGPLVPSTGYLTTFDITGFGNGICLQLPTLADVNKVIPMRRQSKIAATLAEYSHWCDIVGINGVGDLNRAIQNGKAIDIINVAEALHGRKYAAIADEIYRRHAQDRIVMIAGPSSSGKTSSALRIALQCRVLGLNPKVIELDNYFVNRENTPIDENGERDYEALAAMDVAFLNQQLTDLLAGKEVELPKFDFKEGHRVFTGNRLKMEEGDILFMEGFHALNPDLTPAIPRENIFGIYISALSALPGGEKDHGSTTDKRLLRRIVRDNRTRGISPEDNILRWPSVRRGEQRNIFPYEEDANIVFNSSTLYDVPLLKYYAEALLCGISESSPAYEKAQSLLKILAMVTALKPAEIAAVPPTSIMREFIGGQTL